MIYIDTIVNACLIIYYIIISNFDYVITFLTGIGSLIFIYTNFFNIYCKKHIILNNIIHVLFVQGFGALALLKYYIYNN